MSTSGAEPDIAGLELVRPFEAEIPRVCGVYSWWLDTAQFPALEAAELMKLPVVRRTPHASRSAELLYVGRARRNLRQRITRQHLRRTHSSALRRTLLAVLLPGDSSWRNGAAIDGRGRMVLDSDAEDRLTAWMQEHLLLGWKPCAGKDAVDELEKRWICEHRPVLNTDGTKHGSELTALKRTFLEDLPVRSGPPPEPGSPRKDQL